MMALIARMYIANLNNCVDYDLIDGNDDNSDKV